MNKMVHYLGVPAAHMLGALDGCVRTAMQLSSGVVGAWYSTTFRFCEEPGCDREYVVDLRFGRGQSNVHGQEYEVPRINVLRTYLVVLTGVLADLEEAPVHLGSDYELGSEGALGLGPGYLRLELSVGIGGRSSSTISGIIRTV